jgi:hypothetical protein
MIDAGVGVSVQKTSLVHRLAEDFFAERSLRRSEVAPLEPLMHHPHPQPPLNPPAHLGPWGSALPPVPGAPAATVRPAAQGAAGETSPHGPPPPDALALDQHCDPQPAGPHPERPSSVTCDLGPAGRCC